MPGNRAAPAPRCQTPLRSRLALPGQRRRGERYRGNTDTDRTPLRAGSVVAPARPPLPLGAVQPAPQRHPIRARSPSSSPPPGASHAHQGPEGSRVPHRTQTHGHGNADTHRLLSAMRTSVNRGRAWPLAPPMPGLASGPAHAGPGPHGTPGPSPQLPPQRALGRGPGGRRHQETVARDGREQGAASTCPSWSPPATVPALRGIPQAPPPAALAASWPSGRAR